MQDDSPQPTISELIRELIAINQRQMSMLYTLRNGVIYGVGFVIGSSILAAILINASILLFGDFPFFRTIMELVRGH